MTRQNFNFVTICDRSNNSSPITKLQQQFQLLDRLNQILATTIPLNLLDHCHIGAVDETTVVLFVTKAQLFHLIRTFSNQILHGFKENNYYFEQILIKVAKYH